MIGPSVYLVVPVLLLIGSDISTTTITAAAASSPFLVHSSKGRLPSSFVSVWNTLQQQQQSQQKPTSETQSDEEDDDTPKGGEEETPSVASSAAACLLGSQTLTQLEQNSIRQGLLLLSESQDEDDDDKTMLSVSETVSVAGFCRDAAATSSDDPLAHVACLVLPRRDQLVEVVSSVVATQGRLVLAVSAMDWARGEGFVTPALAAALQTLVVHQPSLQESAQLTIVVPEDSDMKRQQALETVLNNFLKTLGSSTKPISLTSVFGQGVDFVSASQAPQVVWKTQTTLPSPVTDMSVLNQATQGMTLATTAQSLDKDPKEVAAARVLTPHVSRLVQQSVATVQRTMGMPSSQEEEDETMAVTTTTEKEEGISLVPAFGELCTATVQSATSEFQQLLKQPQYTDLASCQTTKRLQQQLVDRISAALYGLVPIQLELQKVESMQELSSRLSKLLLGPNLARDMKSTARTVIAEFTKATQRLTSFVGLDVDMGTVARMEFSNQVQERISNALLNARASGKFRPLPRKGITVGMHWLLPKPFGNDYRQEPWMVHATDNLVYVPKASKLVDVADGGATTTTAGDGAAPVADDWRSQIIPHPAGNELIYTQQ